MTTQEYKDKYGYQFIDWIIKTEGADHETDAYMLKIRSDAFYAGFLMGHGVARAAAAGVEK